MIKKLVELTEELAVLSWRATTKEIGATTKPLNKVKEELKFNEELEKEWEKLLVYVRHVEKLGWKAPSELLELKKKQIRIIEELVKKNKKL